MKTTTSAMAPLPEWGPGVGWLEPHGPHGENLRVITTWAVHTELATNNQYSKIETFRQPAIRRLLGTRVCDIILAFQPKGELSPCPEFVPMRLTEMQDQRMRMRARYQEQLERVVPTEASREPG